MWLVSGKPHPLLKPLITRDHTNPELYDLFLSYGADPDYVPPRPCYQVQKSDIHLSIIAEKSRGIPEH